jgi:hypothetical protein
MTGKGGREFTDGCPSIVTPALCRGLPRNNG